MAASMLPTHDAHVIPWMLSSARYSLSGSAFTSTSTTVLSSESDWVLRFSRFSRFSRSGSPCCSYSSRHFLQCSRWCFSRLLVAKIRFALSKTRLIGSVHEGLDWSLDMSQEMTSKPQLSNLRSTRASLAARSAPGPTIVSSPSVRNTTTGGFVLSAVLSWHTILLNSVTSKMSLRARWMLIEHSSQWTLAS
ncbi:hypothetical protein OGATHE_006758 [Ogataea polymorpha]|uniref:Uncharacterized protein n=1 Tax=Ogataea polymorpha TaxID=460523 RepID=A0A9P8NTD4_9ASCO|nr:hypothetical protein OGATHE_006758 [Ogataea polymorpha]